MAINIKAIRLRAIKAKIEAQKVIDKAEHLEKKAAALNQVNQNVKHAINDAMEGKKIHFKEVKNAAPRLHFGHPKSEPLQELKIRAGPK